MPAVPSHPERPGSPLARAAPAADCADRLPCGLTPRGRASVEASPEESAAHGERLFKRNDLLSRIRDICTSRCVQLAAAPPGTRAGFPQPHRALGVTPIPPAAVGIPLSSAKFRKQPSSCRSELYFLISGIPVGGYRHGT